jgi:hypothetical protein
MPSLSKRHFPFFLLVPLVWSAAMRFEAGLIAAPDARIELEMVVKYGRRKTQPLMCSHCTSYSGQNRLPHSVASDKGSKG